MTKILKTGIFGIACAMSMMNVAQVKADINEDYQAIKTAIEEHRSQYTPVKNILKANPEEANKIEQYRGNIQWCIGLAFGGMYSDEWRENYIKTNMEPLKSLKSKLGITDELQEIEDKNIDAGLTNVTFGNLKTKLTDNEYIISISKALESYFPEMNFDNHAVILDDLFLCRLAGAKKMDDGWIVLNGTTSSRLTKGKIGVCVEKCSIFLYDPAKVFPEKIDISPHQPSKKLTPTRRRRIPQPK